MIFFVAALLERTEIELLREHHSWSTEPVLHQDHHRHEHSAQIPAKQSQLHILNEMSDTATPSMDIGSKAKNPTVEPWSR